MLIPYREVADFLLTSGRQVKGILHVGAHDCEELQDYVKEGIDPQNIYWIDAIHEKVEANKQKGIPNVYEAVILDEEKIVDFHETRDPLCEGSRASSSILPLERHAQWYPHITVGNIVKKQTVTLKHWIENNSIPIQKCNFWCLDIQGVELQALRSAEEYIKYADSIYVEVNVESLYKGCSLLPELEAFLNTQGFVRAGLKMAVQGWGDALFVRPL